MNTKSLLAVAIVTTMILGSLPIMYMDESNATDPWTVGETSIYYTGENINQSQLESFALNLESGDALGDALGMIPINTDDCTKQSSELSNISFEFGRYYAVGNDHKEAIKTIDSMKANIVFVEKANYAGIEIFDNDCFSGGAIDALKSYLGTEYEIGTIIRITGTVEFTIASEIKYSWFEGANNNWVMDNADSVRYQIIDGNITIQIGEKKFDINCHIDGKKTEAYVRDFGSKAKDTVGYGTFYNYTDKTKTTFDAFDYKVVINDETKTANYTPLDRDIPGTSQIKTSDLESASRFVVSPFEVGDFCSSYPPLDPQEYAAIINGLENCKGYTDVDTFNAAFNSVADHNGGNNDNTLLYVGIAIIAVVIVGGITVYFLKFKKK